MTNRYRTRAEAVRDARVFIWGDVSLSKRAFVDPRNSPDVAFYDHRGLPVIAVSADVNGHLVVFYFDHYGRSEGGVEVVR
jgi:hypothetical protein